MLEPLLQKWNALTPRDRRMLGLAIGFLLIVFLWLVAFEPAWDGRRQLARELPTLRADLAQMDQLALEARLASTSNRQAIESAAQLRARIEQSLEEAGLTPAIAQLEAEWRADRGALSAGGVRELALLARRRAARHPDARRRSVADAGVGRGRQRPTRAGGAAAWSVRRAGDDLLLASRRAVQGRGAVRG